MIVTMMPVHDVHDPVEAVVSLPKEQQSFSRQPRPRFWLVPPKLSVSEMNPVDGEEIKASASLLQLLERVVSMQRQTVTPSTRASAIFLRLS
jgi:hypothetical protein